MRHFRRTFHLAFAVCVLAAPAVAAPYCLRNQVIPPQCIYNDPAQCQREAARQNGECSANLAELHLSAGFGKYCVISPGGASNCNYTDPSSCNRQASVEHGACVEAPSNQPFQAPNPYSPLNGY